jgi:hypothetical protein
MKLMTLALGALIALLTPGLAHGQTNTGFPPLPPVPQTGQLPASPGPAQFTFIVAGDNRPQGKKPNEPQPEILSQIFQDAQRFKPAFFLWCGDTIAGHTTDGSILGPQYAAFISAASKANVPIFNAPGNHEMDTVYTDPSTKTTTETPNAQMRDFYMQYMGFPPNSPPYAFGAFTYGNSRFIAMNTEEVAPSGLVRSPGRTVASGLKLDPGYVSPDQINLLTQDLQTNQDKDHIFVFMHHPIKPNKAAAGLDPTIANSLQQIFQNNGKVSFVLAAHEHLYFNANSKHKTPPQWSPGTGPIYLVTGGGGAPLDKCGGKVPHTYCGSFNHYLVFTVDGTTVSVQVVELNTTSSKKKGGKK